MTRRTHRSLVASAALALPLMLAACGESGIEEKQIPKGSEFTPPPPTQTEPATPTSVPAAESGPVVMGDRDPAWPWSVPANWRAVPGERPMRLTTYEIPLPDGPVEVAVTRFPGDVGGMLANVNRWRGQIGLPPVAEADLPGMLVPFTTPGFEGALMRLEGPQVHMLAASIFEPAADRTWFVRITVPGPTADRVWDEFAAFSRSFMIED